MRSLSSRTTMSYMRRAGGQDRETSIVRLRVAKIVVSIDGGRRTLIPGTSRCISHPRLFELVSQAQELDQ